MTIQRIGSQASQRAPAEHFTGTVRIDPLFQSSPPAHAAAGLRNVRALRTERLAYAPARPDPDRHVRVRAPSALGRAHRRDPTRRRGDGRDRTRSTGTAHRRRRR